jgi:hypothetical protein
VVELLLEGLISQGVDSVDRRLHARRMARFAERLGVRHDPSIEAPNMMRALGEIAGGRLTHVFSGTIDGGHFVAWERELQAPVGDDLEQLKNHPAGHFVAVPLPRRLPGVVAQRAHPLITPDECPWLPGGTRMHLSNPTAERLFRVTAVDHGFARRIVDEDALLARPRRSWAILGAWAVCLGPGAIRRRGRWGLRRELDFTRALAAKAAAA